MGNHKNPFYRVSALVTAIDMQQPLASSVEAEANAYVEFHRLLGYPDDYDRMSLVLDDSEVVGWWWPYDEDLEESCGLTVNDVMCSIPLSAIVSANTSFYDLADLFTRRKHPFVFVADGTELTGTVSYLDLFSRIGQLCLIALAFDLESTSEELCCERAKQCWSALSPERRSKAETVFAGRNRFPQIATDMSLRLPELIRSTTFIDKGNMIAKTKLVPEISKRELISVFALAEQIRNLCAHGATEQELSRVLRQDKLSKFLHRTQDTTELIRVAVKNLGSAEL